MVIMGKRMLAAGFGLGLALFNGCAAPEKTKTGVFWEDAQPTGVRYIVDDGSERFVRTREFFSYVGQTGGKQAIEITEEQILGTNRWRGIAAERPANKELYDILGKRLPGLAEVLEDPRYSIGDVVFEDIYENDKRVGTQIRLPDGRIEEYLTRSPENIK